jgi:nucleotide sugar dehydrogenase
MVKPVLDVTIGTLLSLITFPVVVVLMAMAAVTFGGAGIDRVARLGKHGIEFNLYRIRTSKPGVPEARGRRRRVFSLMRRWSLDELPQLWNVARGRMSLVGPRPISPAEGERLKDWQLHRHDVKPGVTGLWQVEARGDGRQLLDNIHFDIRYIDQLSFVADLRVMAMTLGTLVFHRQDQQLDQTKPARRPPRINHLRLIVTDGLLWPIAVTLAVFARFDFSFDQVDWGRMLAVWLIAVTAQLSWGYAVGLYRGRWRLGSSDEAVRIAAGTGLITAVLTLLATHVTTLVPRGAIVAAGTSYLLGAFAVRYLARAIYTRRHRSNHQRVGRLIVFGAGRAGIEAVEAMQQDPQGTMEPVAFLDDDRNKRGNVHLGLPVLGSSAVIPEAAWRYGADYLLVAMPSAPSDEIDRVSRLAAEAGLQVEIVPALSQSLSTLLVDHARSVLGSVPPVRQPVASRRPSGQVESPVARQYDLGVIGLGYVGLPAAIEATGAGLRVLGLDIDEDKIESLNAGASYIEDIADEDLAVALAGGFHPTTDASQLALADVITISVPTPLRDGLPDLNAVIGASQAVGDCLNMGQTIVLESTTYPGTTDEVVRPILEERSGLTAGVDFYLAYSPERIDPGNTEWGVHNTPKLVGGINEESAERAAQIYRKFAPVVVMSGTKEAEMAKLLENTYRHVNIALVNEMAVFADLLGVDIWETIRGAATKPFGFQAFYPGPGVGGHCIPIDPNYLSYRVRQLGSQFKMIELAQEINDFMPSYVARRATQLLTSAGVDPAGSTALILGIAYKAGIGDVRETPATALVRALRLAGMRVIFTDPFVSDFAVDGESVPRVEDPVAGAGSVDIVIIHTPHSEFDVDRICSAATSVLDARGVTAPGRAERL